MTSSARWRSATSAPAELLALLLEHTDPDAEDDAWNPVHDEPVGGYTDLDTGRPYVGDEDNTRPTRRPPTQPQPHPEPDPDPGPEPEPDESVAPVSEAEDQLATPDPRDEDEPDFEPLVPDPQHNPRNALCRPLAFPAELLATLHALGLVKLRSEAILYVHIHQNVLDGTVDGVARVEGIGPMTRDEDDDNTDAAEPSGPRPTPLAITASREQEPSP